MDSRVEQAMKPRIKALPLIEVAVFYVIALAVIWLGGKFRPTIGIAALLLLAICVASNRFHGDSVERIGLSRKKFWPATKLAFGLSAPFLLTLVLIASRKSWRGEWNFWFSLIGYPVWGFVQEYALLGFVANRLEDGLQPIRSSIPWINGFLFSMAHLPNPALMVITAISGTLFTGIFFRTRQLIPLSLVHALFGIALNLAYSDVYGIMSVGPAYIGRVGNPPPLLK